MEYGFSKSVNLSFEQATDKITEELKKEGFGILTEIDVKETMKQKLNWILKIIKFLVPVTLLLLIGHYNKKKR